jgi:hypothetical protein
MKYDKTSVAYNPAALLDTLLQHLRINSDHALSRKLKVTKDIITRIREGSIPVGASMLLWMHEASGISVDELRKALGDRRAKCRLQALRPVRAASAHQRAYKKTSDE